MRTRRRLFTLTTALLAVPFAVTAVAATAAAAPAAPAHHGGRPAGAVVITTEHTKFGTVLVTGTGESLYVFSGDNFGFSTAAGTPQLACTALNVAPAPASTPCTTAWPPLTATSVIARGGVAQKGLGTVTRNGVTQVTYFGQPVYGFIKDTAAGDINGEDVAAFDGMWYLVHPSGVAAATVPTITTETSANGIVLASPTAAGGRTLYSLTADTPRTSACTGQCAALWPPLLTANGRARVGTGAERRLGVIRRADGTLQVTYNGHPVYFFAFDLGAGAPAGLTTGEYILDPAPVDGNWYTVLPQGIADPGTTTIGSESAGGANILAVAGNPINKVVATLYAFSADSATASTCTGQCAMIWPAVITTTPAAVSGMASAGKLGTIPRADGTFQVTYNGHPLYFFAKALDSGTEGSNVMAFGGTFNIVNVSGAVG
jgi:predicted lipoprotein with Yx(FWY)xxD motif